MLRRFICITGLLGVASFAGCGAKTGSPAPNGVAAQGNIGAAQGYGGGSVGAGAGVGAGGPGAIGGSGNVGGGLGNGGSVLIGLGNGGGTTMMDAGHGCAAIESAGEAVQLDLYIMDDQSLSMNCIVTDGGATTRWQAAVSALDGVVTDPGASGIGIGIQYFGQNTGDQGMPGLFSSCAPADYQNPDVEIAPLPGNAMAMQNSLASHMPATNTPTPAALEGAINHTIDYRNKHPGETVAVVLVTDGQPNACGAVADVANIAQTGLQQANIKTFVIGIISTMGETCVVDPAPPNEADLDTVAMAGGTNKAFMIDVSGNASQQFLMAMNNIRGQIKVPCQYQIPLPPTGALFDKTKVNVVYSDASGNANIVYKVTQSTCDANTGGWYYDNENDPKSIILCTASCNTISTQVVTVNIELNCQTQGPPS